MMIMMMMMNMMVMMIFTTMEIAILEELRSLPLKLYQFEEDISQKGLDDDIMVGKKWERKNIF